MNPLLSPGGTSAEDFYSAQGSPTNANDMESSKLPDLRMSKTSLLRASIGGSSTFKSHQSSVERDTNNNSFYTARGDVNDAFEDDG